MKTTLLSKAFYGWLSRLRSCLPRARHPFFFAAFFLAAHIDFARCLASSRWAGVHFFLAVFAAVVVGTGSACFFPAAGCAFLDPDGRPRLLTPAPKA
jgi:hypothetical protein